MTWADLTPCPRCGHRHTSDETEAACARRCGAGGLPRASAADLLERWLPTLLATGRVFDLEVEPGGRVRLQVAEGTSATPEPVVPQPTADQPAGESQGPRIAAVRR